MKYFSSLAIPFFSVLSSDILKVVVIVACLESNSGGRTLKSRIFLCKGISVSRWPTALAPPLLKQVFPTLSPGVHPFATLETVVVTKLYQFSLCSIN